MNRMPIWILFLVISVKAMAVTAVQFPEDELPSEVVMPSGLAATMIYNPTVKFAKKIQASIGAGAILDDPYFDGSNIKFGSRYFLSQYWALGLDFHSVVKKTSTYAEQFRGQRNLNFEQAPNLSQIVMIDSRWQPYYGKMSVSQDLILNQTFFVEGGLGLLRYQNSAGNFYGLQMGFGQNFFWTDSWSFDYSLHFMLHSAPNILSQDLSKTVTGDYSSKYQSHFLFNFGVSKLF